MPKAASKPQAASQTVDLNAILSSAAASNDKKSKKNSVPEIKGHEVLADQIAAAYIAMNDAETAFKVLESQLLDVARKEYQERSEAKAHTKSLNFDGAQTQGVQVSYKDQFVNAPIAQEGWMKEVMGASYNEYFETVRKIELKDTSNETVLLLISKLGEAEFVRLFDVKQSVAAKADFDRHQWQVPETCRLAQYKPSTKLRTK